jgi:PGF-pre-PGF domain-containing protein
VSGRGWQQLLSTIICASFLFVSLPPTYTLSPPETGPTYENIENVGGRLSLSNGALAGYYISDWIWAAEGSELEWAENEPELTESFESAPSRVENLPDGTSGFGLLFEGRPEAEELELFLSGWGENAKLYVWSGGWEFLGGLNENFQRRFQLRPASKYLVGTDVWVKLEGRVELEGARLVCKYTHKSKVFVQISDESGRWFGANGENSYFDSPPIPVEGRFRFRVEIRRDSPSLNPWFEFQGLRKGKPRWVATVDPDLLQALENCPPDNEFFVIIFLKEQPWIPKELKRAELPGKAKYLKETVLPRQEKLLEFLRSKGIQVKYRFWLYNAVAAVVPARFIEEVAKLPFVWYVYWDRPLPLKPCDDISVQNVRATDVHTATPENYTGAGVRVGILGSGIKNNVTWLQRGGVSVVVKDFRGDLNAESTTDVWDIGGAYTDDSHETNVACVLAGQAPENIGVAPGVDVYDLVFFDTSGNAYASYLINCIQYAASENVSILSMSYGMTSYISGTPPTYYIYPYTYRYPHSEIAERAVQLGIFFVNAAGNEGPATASLRSSIAGAEAITTAGGYWDADTVAPEDDNFHCPAYSNPEFFSKGPGSFGTFKPEIVAPAAKIWAQNADNTFSEVGGTSFAAPHVAGGAALVKQRHPDWGPWEIKMALVNSARRMGDNHPFLQGAGALNCYKAVFNDVLIGVPQWYDYRIPSSGSANIFRQEDQESDNIMGAELALSPTWTVTLPPGENTSTIIYVMNYRTTPLNLSFSYQTFPDIDNSSRPLNATFTVPSPITVPARASLALPLKLSLAANQYPGIYAAFLEFSDGENTFRVPVSVVVPAILSPGANQLTFTYNHVFGAQDDVDEYDRGGEWHLLPFFISSPASNVTATWTFASGGYDFSLMDSIGREDRYADNHAWMASTSPTSLTLTGVKPGLWWISSHYYTGSGNTYQAKIDLNGSDAVQISSAVFYSPLTQTLDLLARVVGIGGGANISSVSFTIYKDNSQHKWSTYPDYDISDIPTGLGGSLQNLGSGLWSVRGFDASLLYENSGPGAYYALITADNGTAKWTGASPLFFVPDVRVKAWALRTGFENVLVYARADCSTHGSIDNTKVRLNPSYAVFEVGSDNLRGTMDDNFQFSGPLSWNPQLSRWEAVLDTSSIDENRCYAVVTFLDNWLHCSCGATNLFYASEWVQTDWKGGSTPSLQTGTWMEDYDNFYSSENLDYSGAGSLRLAVENYENLYTYVTSYAAITGAVANFANQQSAGDAGAYSTLQEASGTLTIFYDGFESGGFTEGGWVLSSPAPVVSTNHPYQGSYAAGGSVAIFGATTNTYSFAKTLNTSGYSNATLSYARAVEDAGAGTITFVAEYSTDGGSTWTTLETQTDTNNVYSVVSFSVPSAPQLTIRFRGTFGGAAQNSANCFWVDEVRVTGDASAMEIRENISGVPQAENYFLEIRYALDNANENFRLEVWNGSSWEPVMYLSSTAWVENSVQLGPQHVSGSTVMVRFVNATVGGLATNLLIDYLRVRSVVPLFKPAGWLESSAFDSRSVADWGLVRWSADIPAQTSLCVWIRSSSDAANWGPWCLHENNTENSFLEDDRYVQYRIEFFTDNVYLTPKLYDMTILFRPWWWGPPQAPSLLSPENGTRDSENTPTFVWTGGRGMKRFWLQIDNDSDFSSPVYNNRNIFPTQTSSRIENELTVGTYYWRVVAANAFGENSSEIRTYVCIPPYWRTLETWSGSTYTTACYQSVEVWTANLPAGAQWCLNEGWTETVCGTAVWQSLEGWTDSATSSITGWTQLEGWQLGSTGVAWWEPLEGWQGTVSPAVWWWEVEGWQTVATAGAGWEQAEVWACSICALPTGWSPIEDWIGTLRAPASWVQLEGLGGTVGTAGGWFLIDSCTGTPQAPASWFALEGWGGEVGSLAGWSAVDSWTATFSSLAQWSAVEGWEGMAQTTVSWTTVEGWIGTVGTMAGWLTADSWTSILSPPAGWQAVETWTCTARAQAGWLEIEACTGTLQALAGWTTTEGWIETVQSPASWQEVEGWSGDVGAGVTWQPIDSWDGTVRPQAGWVSAESWSCGLQAPSTGWQPIEGWTGSVAAPALALPGAPVLLSPDNNAIVTLPLTFTWVRGSNADNHRIEIDNDDNFQNGVVENVWRLPPNDNWYTTENLDYGTYYWRVWAVNVSGENCSENIWTFTLVAVWRTLESWTGGASSIPPTWSAIDSWTCTASTLPFWSSMESWTGAFASVPPLWSGIDSWPGTASTIPVWSAIDSWTCATSSPAVWITIDSWSGTASSIPPAWSSIESWAGTASSVLPAWIATDSWTCTTATVPTAWTATEFWICTTSSTPPAWSTTESWSCTATSIPTAWSAIDSWAGTTSSIPSAWAPLDSWVCTASSVSPVWSAIDSWVGEVCTAGSWKIIDSWTCTLISPSSWQCLEALTGNLGAPSGWNLLQVWVGSIQAPTQWQVVETWAGTASTLGLWSVLESWTGTVSAFMLWRQLECWEGTATAPAGWVEVEGWSGTAQATAGWLMVDSLTGSACTLPGWSTLEGWSGRLEAATWWAITDWWDGTLRGAAEWQVVESCSSSAHSLAVWSTVEGWSGTVGTTAGWSALEAWAGTSTSAATWCLIDEWQGGASGVAAWVCTDFWTGEATALAGWSALDSCSGSMNTLASWIASEGWGGTLHAPAEWQKVEGWDGTVSAVYMWRALEGWSETVGTTAGWLEIEAWAGGIRVPVTGWLGIEAWTGRTVTVAEWSGVEFWAETLRTQASWLMVETRFATICAPAGWLPVDSWAGGVQTRVAWSVVEELSGTAQTTVQWLGVEGWTGTLGAPAEWLATESWAASVAAAPLGWCEVEGWSGGTQAPTLWSAVEDWAGRICAPAGWLAVDSYTGVVQTRASWQELEGWMGTARSAAGWSPIESYTGGVGVPAGWTVLESVAGEIRFPASWQTLETWTCTISSAPPAWSTVESWACTASSIPPTWSVMESWAGTTTSIPAWSSIESWTGTTFSPSAWNVMDSWTVAAYSLTAWSAIDLWTCTTASIPPAWLTIDSQACMASSIPPAWSAIESWTCMLPATASWLTLESQAGTARSPAFWELGESWDCSCSAPFAGWFEIDRWAAGAGTFMPEWLSIEGWSGTTQFSATWLGVEAWTQEVGAAAGWQMVEGYGVCLENLAGWFLLELWESAISSTPAMWFRLEQLEGSPSAPPRWTCLESWLSTANFAAGWTPIDSRAASLSSITFWRTLETGSGEIGSPPAPPTLTWPENASTTTPTPTFQWGATSPLDNFRLEVDNDSDFSSPEDNLTFGHNTTSWTKPAPGYAVDNYYWRVWAINRFGESCSIVRIFRVLLGPPTQPVLLSPENGGSAWTAASLAWRRAEGADNHRLEISINPQFQTLVENVCLQPPEDNSYTALLSGPGVYYWRVWGVNQLGENCSEVWSFRAYLAAPRLLSPADGSNTNTPPTLNWENLTPVDNFELQVDNDQDFGSPEVRVSLTGTSYTVSLPDGLYYWRVRAFRWGENSPWSIRTFRIDTVPPSKPTLLFPVNVSTNDNTPLFQWLHVPENSLPVAYWIQIDNDQTFNEPYVFSFGWILDNKFELPTASSLPDGVYYWRIRARDNAGNLGIWSSASFRVDTRAPPAPVPSAPVGGTWASIRPVLSWQSVQDPSSVQYKVYLCEQPSFSIPYRVYESDWLTENSWQAPVLEEALGLEGKFFYWRVCARDGAGNVGENSPTENFRVDNYVAKVTLLSPENGSLVSGTVEFEWYSVTDASGISGYWFQLSTSEQFTYLLENVEVKENLYLTSLYLPGNYYWRVCAIDNVGNRGPWSDCFTVRVSGWVGLESWESRPVAGGWWREIEGLQAGTAIEAWRQVESMQGGTAATANWREVERVSSGAQTERGWRWLESRFLRALSRVGWISIEGESASLSTPTAPAPVMVPLGAWGPLERWEGKALVPSRWLEVDRSAASTLPIALSISPERASVEQGGTVYAIIRVERRYTSPVRLETDTLPGATIALSPSEGVPAFQSVLRVEVGASVQVGTYELGIYARTDGITVRGTFVLEVRPPTRSAPFVAAGTSGRFDFSDLRTPINRVEVEAIENVTEPYLIIEFLKQLPSGTPVPELPVYVYARARTNVPNRSARFSFTVEESWLRAQGAGAELVCMLRLGERWEEISARPMGENAGGRMYEVTVPRLSEVTMLAIACRRPVRVPLTLLLFGLALGAGIGIGGWLLLHLLRPKPVAFRPPREVLERLRRTMGVGPAMPPRRVILERYKKAVVYRKKPKLRTVEGMAETRKVEELWERLNRRVRPGMPPKERRPQGYERRVHAGPAGTEEHEKALVHKREPRPRTVEELWERLNRRVRPGMPPKERPEEKKAVVYKKKPRPRTVEGMTEARRIAEELWESLGRRARKK